MTRIPIIAVTATTALAGGTSCVRLNTAYVDALVAAGVVPLVLPPLAASATGRVLDMVQGLVLTGGEDVGPSHYHEPPHRRLGPVHPERDASEIALAHAARHRRLPTLAICRGMQVLNVAEGGNLIQDIPTEAPGDVAHDVSNCRRERVHAVHVMAGSRLARIVGAGVAELRTNSMHHQAVKGVAGGYHASATAADGIVEAIEPDDEHWWMLGVQWHPEELTGAVEDWDRQIFRAFAAACAREAESVSPRASTAQRP